MMDFIHLAELSALNISLGFVVVSLTVYNILDFPRMLATLAGTPLPKRADFATEELYKAELRSWLSKLLILGNSVEDVLAPDSRNFRSTLSSHPLLSPLLAPLPQVRESATLRGGVSGQSFNDKIETRSPLLAPIGLLLCLVIPVLVSLPEVREKINSKAGPGRLIPKFMLEQLSCTRESLCGSLRIVPGVSSFGTTLFSDMGVEKTLLDVNFLATDVGIDAFFSLLGVISQAEKNHIEFVEFISPVPINSGQQTTFMASWFTSADNTVNLLNGHSYGTRPNGVHIVNAIVQNRSFYLNANGVLTPFIPNTSAFSVPINYSSYSLVMFCISQVIGKISNDPRTPVRRYEKKEQPAQPNNRQKQNNAKQQQPQSTETKLAIALLTKLLDILDVRTIKQITGRSDHLPNAQHA